MKIAVTLYREGERIYRLRDIPKRKERPSFAESGDVDKILSAIARSYSRDHDFYFFEKQRLAMCGRCSTFKRTQKNYAPFISERNPGKSQEWIGPIKPTPASQTYTVKIFYAPYAPYARSSPSLPVEVHVLDPELKPRSETQEIPHIWWRFNRSLCLYKPSKNEWNPDDLLADTVVPWLAEWLAHYEYWHATGEWHGGGDHPSRLSNLEGNLKSRLLLRKIEKRKKKIMRRGRVS